VEWSKQIDEMFTQKSRSFNVIKYPGVCPEIRIFDTPAWGAIAPRPCTRGGERIYYHEPHELRINAGGAATPSNFILKFYFYLNMRKSDFSWLTIQVPTYHRASF